MAKSLLEKKFAEIEVDRTKGYDDRFAAAFPDLMIRSAEMDPQYSPVFSNGERTGAGQAISHKDIALVPVFVPARCLITGLSVMNANNFDDGIDLEAAIYRHDGSSPMPAEKVTNSYFVAVPEFQAVGFNEVLRFVDKGHEAAVWQQSSVVFTPFSLSRGIHWVAIMNRSMNTLILRGASATNGRVLMNMFMHGGAWTSSAGGLVTGSEQGTSLPANMKAGRLLRPTFTGVSADRFRLRNSVMSVELSYER